MQARANTTPCYWYVVADEARAIVYASSARRGSLSEIYSADNAAARAKVGDLISERGGRSFDRFGPGRHTMENERGDPKTQAATRFAKSIAEHIAGALGDGSCREYALLAPPKFLGLLRAAIGRCTNDTPFMTIAKNVVAHDLARIEKLIEDNR